MIKLLKMKKIAIVAAGALACTSALADTTISSGDISANIRDDGNIYGTTPADGSLGLSYKGTEFVNIDIGNSWIRYKDGTPHDLTAQFATNPWTTTATPLSSSSVVVNGATADGFLKFQETTSIISPNVMTVAVTLHNASSSTLSGLFWGVGFDPDQGGSGKNTTFNTILGQGASAAVNALDTLFGTGLGVTLANTTALSTGSSVTAFINVGDCCSAVDPAAVALQSVGFTHLGDDSISLNYSFGDLAANGDLTFGYSYTFAIPEPEIYAMMGVGLMLMGFVARRRRGQAAAAFA